MNTEQRIARERRSGGPEGIYDKTSPEKRTRIQSADDPAAPGWWKKFNLSYAKYVSLESVAVGVRNFVPNVFPGLLQTPDYARALHARAYPPVSVKRTDEQIEVRRVRQQALVRKENPLKLSAIVDEAVLHRVVGGPEVMERQITHVIEASRRKNIAVRVLPYSAGSHPALGGSFILLEPARSAPSVVYVEGLSGRSYLDAPDDIERYEEIYRRLDGIALDLDASMKVMAKVRAKYQQRKDLLNGSVA